MYSQILIYLSVMARLHHLLYMLNKNNILHIFKKEFDCLQLFWALYLFTEFCLQIQTLVYAIMFRSDS